MLPRLFTATGGGQCVDVPELADQKCGLGRAEVVVRCVAHDVTVAVELPSDRFARAQKAFIARWQQAKLGKQQDAGIEFVMVEGADDGPPALVPGPGENCRANLVACACQ